jgi:hypothetical protein
MVGEPITIRGVIRNGLIVLDQPLPYADGAPVTVTVCPAAPDRAEVTRLTEDAVREVDQWERQE